MIGKAIVTIEEGRFRLSGTAMRPQLVSDEGQTPTGIEEKVDVFGRGHARLDLDTGRRFVGMDRIGSEYADPIAEQPVPIWRTNDLGAEKRHSAEFRDTVDGRLAGQRLGEHVEALRSARR